MTEKLLTVEELAEELKTPPSWIYSRTRQTGPDSIPVIRVGKYCRFKISDVLAWLERKSEESDNN
jgi:excisionase family DNA binding protein